MKKIISIIILIVIIIGGFYLLFSYSSNQLNAQNLISAIEENDIDKFEKLLKKRGDIDAKPNVVCLDCTNYPPLHMACKLGNFEAVKLLVENGADVNNVNATNNTSPLIAALRTHNSNGIEVAKYLINKGADISYMNLQGYTPVNASLRLNTNPYNEDVAKAQYDFVV
ncbi:ankyrin repeat domain-containing protein [Mycoplasmatota bacterium]|nr:ankyrin repeat domain-containing protein [Mycoplasmatota bacterium]